MVALAEPPPLQDPLVVMATANPDDAVAATVNVSPYVAFAGAAVVTVIVCVPATTVNGALVPGATRSPAVRVAVIDTPLSAFEYVNPSTETALLLAGIVPEDVPLSEPVPVARVRLKLVAAATFDTLPNASCDWTLIENGAATAGFKPPLTEGIVSLLAAAAETRTVSLSEPVALIVPSVTAMTAVSALYSVTTPLLPLDTVATPFVKVIAVTDPNATAVPVLFRTVGAVMGFVEEFAPENVSDLGPV
jgi:hypothetical protein